MRSPATLTPAVPFVLVFVASASVMVIELVASRMIAQYVGSNLYTWTSIIAVVLTGITVGNLLGGWAADRLGVARTRTALGTLFVAGGFLSLVAVVALGPVFTQEDLSSLPLPVRVLTSVTIVYFLPSTVLGAVSPLAAAWALSLRERLGVTVGALYAVSSLGAIVGTLLTGFVLISAFGTTSIMVGVAAALALIGAAIGRRLPVVLAAAFVAAAALSVGVASSGRFASPAALRTGDVTYLRDTAYQTVAVTVDPFRGFRTVVLDNLVHGYVDPMNPTLLIYPYIATYATAYDVARERAGRGLSSLHLGGGAYTLPRYLAHVYPDDEVIVAEIDPGVTAASRASAGLSDPAPFELHHADARAVVGTIAAEGRRVDVVFADAFHDYGIPFHLATVEFYREVEAVLTPAGLALLNVIDDLQEPRMLAALVETIGAVHAHVAVFSMAPLSSPQGRNTFVVASSNAPIEVDAIVQLAQGAGLQIRSVLVDEIHGLVPVDARRVLTDDHAPVERLVAHLYRRN